MAKTSSKSKYRLEHRLLGAVVLVLIAVIVIPLILREPAPTIGVNTSAEQEGENVFRSKIEALAEEAQLEESLKIERVQKAVDNISEDALESVLEPIEKAANNQQPSNKLVVQDQSQTPQNNASQPVQAEPDKAATSNNKTSNNKDIQPEASKSENVGNWEVRVGTFTKNENAESLKALLKKAGFNAKTTDARNSLGNVTRVWLGPYANRETAEKMRDRLKALTDQDGFVSERAGN